MGLAIFDAIALIVEKFLELKVLQEQNKYSDLLLSLRKAYRDEFNKSVWDGKDIVTDASNFRNDAQLAEFLAQLCDLATAVATAARK